MCWDNYPNQVSDRGCLELEGGLRWSEFIWPKAAGPDLDITL